MTVREYVVRAQAELRGGQMQPERARELLAELASLIGNCNDEIRKADAAYASHLLLCYDTEKTSNRAKIVAETSPEYQRKREARDTKEVLLEMIRALKHVLRGIEEEMRLAGRV